MMQVENIQPNNEALKFIDLRIADPKYRGDESSEHNRYDMKEIFTTLTILDKYAPDKSLLRIRDTDLSKRPQNTNDEISYALFCEDVKKAVGKGTQDSIRKNIFVDIHRMGLIDRFDNEKIKLGAFDRGSVKYVSLTDDGIKFIKSNLLNRAFIFSKALDRLLGGYIEISLDILKDTDYGINKITLWEFMFFVSAINAETTFNIDINQCVTLIKSFRLLAPTQRMAVIETLKQKLKPELFIGDKTKKRDWHNWKNKIDQAYHLFKQTPYFDVFGTENKILTLSTTKIKTKDGEVVDIKKRSIYEKDAYFKKHKVQKTNGFELHHVLPLSWSESAEQYKLFDKWENMVYIDAFSHAKISQNRNRNVNMTSRGDDIILSDYDNNSVHLISQKSILYDTFNKSKMLDYNRDLLTTI